MDIVRLRPAQWPLWRNRLYRFALRYGERRLTTSGLRTILGTGGEGPILAVQEVTSSPPYAPARTAPTFAAVIAYHRSELLGFAFAADAGRQACLVVVHPKARGQGVGLALIRKLVETFGELCCHVSADNTASLRLFFRAGLKAVALEDGPTGKPTLLLQTDRFHTDTTRRLQASCSAASAPAPEPAPCTKAAEA
ncbi:GNAT family N-acetyltransferase [Paenibacillus xylaniclasticus]|uniref:GNAT family N-acetyltransferase n=1 Tax=Paenibacillus xylaniclasticus TaxID=588083 RepID=UPI000FD6F425|nr:MULTISPECIES: GNAT family N-acetyltransferase [Paenibacillus]GFN30880.1 hypothetical protein PCURB6_11400 [Paenibacillus curdlanolyticus]